MKRMILTAAIFTLSAFALPHDLNPHGAATPAFARCTGSTPCNACKNCHYCKHCAKDGGTCGVCRKK